MSGTRYVCTICGREVGKLNLKVKRASFKEVGKGGAAVRTRTVAWLCVIDQEDGTPGCLYLDPDWNRPAYTASPGMSDTTMDADDDEQDEPLFPPESEVKKLSNHLRENPI